MVSPSIPQVQPRERKHFLVNQFLSNLEFTKKYIHKTFNFFYSYRSCKTMHVVIFVFSRITLFLLRMSAVSTTVTIIFADLFESNDFGVITFLLHKYNMFLRIKYLNDIFIINELIN